MRTFWCLPHPTHPSLLGDSHQDPPPVHSVVGVEKEEEEVEEEEGKEEVEDKVVSSWHQGKSEPI
jgi:hypothetical protein